jgi:hypothetical protein
VATAKKKIKEGFQKAKKVYGDINKRVLKSSIDVAKVAIGASPVGRVASLLKGPKTKKKGNLIKESPLLKAPKKRGKLIRERKVRNMR